MLHWYTHQKIKHQSWRLIQQCLRDHEPARTQCMMPIQLGTWNKFLSSPMTEFYPRTQVGPLVHHQAPEVSPSVRPPMRPSWCGRWFMRPPRPTMGIKRCPSRKRIPSCLLRPMQRPSTWVNWSCWPMTTCTNCPPWSLKLLKDLKVIFWWFSHWFIRFINPGESLVTISYLFRAPSATKELALLYGLRPSQPRAGRLCHHHGEVHPSAEERWAADHRRRWIKLPGLCSRGGCGQSAHSGLPRWEDVGRSKLYIFVVSEGLTPLAGRRLTFSRSNKNSTTNGLGQPMSQTTSDIELCFQKKHCGDVVFQFLGSIETPSFRTVRPHLHGTSFFSQIHARRRPRYIHQHWLRGEALRQGTVCIFEQFCFEYGSFYRCSRIYKW